MSTIETKNIKKYYHEGTDIEVRALDGVGIHIAQGEFTAIVGPSGSGKTTLLNIIGGLDKATSGIVTIDGEQISEMSSNELINYRLNHIGFVFQAYNLIPVLSAIENVEFITLLQDWPADKRRERAVELLKQVGLQNEMAKRPNQMSGGQQQRVAVARALASKPSFVLADEPTANLDSKSTSDLLDIMLQLNQEEGTTFIFSTHDQRVIDKARRVITLEDGKIVHDEIRA
jgi:putative ABC transport system ATP-binding protein